MLEFLLFALIMLAFWWVIRRDMNHMRRLWDLEEAQRRYDAARAARSGDHD